jgi:hypothetical protein
METHKKRPIAGYAMDRQVVVFTHDGAGADGKPAVCFDPMWEKWWIENDGQPLTMADSALVIEALAMMSTQIAAVNAAMASEQH